MQILWNVYKIHCRVEFDAYRLDVEALQSVPGDADIGAEVS